MAEPFQTIENRPKSVFVDTVQKDGMQESTNILIVTHAFAIKTIFHLFAPEQLSGLGKFNYGFIRVGGCKFIVMGADIGSHISIIAFSYNIFLGVVMNIK